MAARPLVLPDPGLDQFLEQSHRHRLIQREAVRALAGHVAVQLFVLLRLTHRIHADVVFERREIDQPSLVVEVGHPIAESLGGFRRHCLDQFAQLTKAWQIKLIDIADTTPVFVSKVPTIGGIVDILVVSTMSGRVMAINAENGTIIWSVDGPVGPRWTTSSPAIDPNRKYVYAYGLDGYVHRYAIGDGSEVNRDGWPELITLKGEVEKCSSALSVVTTNSGDNYLYATIAAYPDPGDEGDYQGHLVAVNLADGSQHVFNALSQLWWIALPSHGSNLS